jgi:peptidoglycan-associated lipoprotein
MNSLFLTSIVFAIFLTSCSTKKQPEKAAEIIVAPVRKEETSMKLTINIAKVYFFFDSSELKPQAKNLILSKIESIKSANLPVVIEGHCDQIGTEEYNKILGESRAKSVKDFLVENGIEDSMIKVISFGKDSPEIKENTKEAYRLNRRAIITINN